MSQIALPLGWPEAPGDDAFLITPCNTAASLQLEDWKAWPVLTALLVGPRKSGRSLLARVFAAKTGGAIIDNAERQPEVTLFHAWNRAQAERRPLLLVADAAPPVWTPALPDLQSRLAASPVVTIEPPDDQLVHALLERQFARRGLDARPDLTAWLAARIERTHVALQRTVDVLDQQALETRKRLSIPLARDALIAAGLIARVER